MTYVGKILVFVIMGFSLVFLGISTVVFTTATDWKKAADAQKQKVGELTKKNGDATAEIASIKKDLDKAKADHAAAKKALDDKIAQQTADIERMQKDITAARGDVVTAQQNAKTALDEADARRNETNLLREQKLAVEKQANEFKTRQTELNDEIRILSRERDVAKKNADDLRDKSARFSSLLRKHGLSDDISTIRGLESPPPVHGEVARVDAQNKTVQLTIGSDDGLVPGHELYLWRDRPRPEYLGKIRILTVDPDQAVGVVIGTTIQGKKIKEGDIVRPRSAPARGASAGARPAAGGRPGVFVQAPKSDVYVALLGVALGAMILGAILLLLVFKRYDFKVKASSLDRPAQSALAANFENSQIRATVHL